MKPGDKIKIIDIKKTIGLFLWCVEQTDGTSAVYLTWEMQIVKMNKWEMMDYLNYHHNGDEQEDCWDTFKNADGMTYYTPNDRKFEL